jgi:YfiH family protein
VSDRLENGFVYPGWSAPANVKAVMTTRSGGVSTAPFDSMNLGDHVNDDADSVKQNRALLRDQLALPQNPIWLSQVHGTVALQHEAATEGDAADAIVAHKAKQVCAIMTADCLPVLFCNKQGTVVAAAHAGWRGLESGVLESTITGMQCASEDILVWLGAAIGPTAFEVGEEVQQAFVDRYPETHVAFAARENGKFLADIYSLARIRLQIAGIQLENITGGEWCTHSQSELYYSYRRESRTGRMASLIWFD